MWNDVRLAVRLLIKDRGFIFAAALALALGIAANTTMFTIANGIFLRDLPFDAPDRIVLLTTEDTGNARGRFGGVSYPELRDWEAGTRTFDGMSVFTDGTMNLADDAGPADRFRGTYLSANAFRLIGAGPALGRDFRPEDDGRGAAPVVMLGHAVWQSRYGSDPGVLGRTLRVNGVPSTVIGVMPEGFEFPDNARVWQPIGVRPADQLERRAARELEAFGRLKPGIAIEQAQADLRSVADELTRQFPDTNANVVPWVMPFREKTVGGTARRAFRALMAAVGFVLLIACANVANLLLARATARAREMSVRMSIGASRWRIVRQLLVESLLLAVLAGAVGLGLSILGVRLFSNAASSDAPYWVDFTIDGRVFLFLASVCLGTAILFGLIPALHTSRVSLTEVLNEAGRGSTAGVRSHRWTGALVVVQLALTIVLLTGAGLSIRDLVAQYQLDAGIQTSGLTLARLSLPASTYPGVEERALFYRQLDERLATMPNVQASFASAWPRGGSAAGPREISLEGQPPSTPGARPTVTNVHVGPRYFATLGTRPVRGREFTPGDVSRVAIVNDRFATRFFPDGEAIGRQIRLEATAPIPASDWLTIVGVVPNVRQHKTPNGDFDPIVYVPYGSVPMPFAMVLIRSGASAGATTALLREHVRALDADLPLFDVMPLDEKLAEDHAEVRELSSFLGAFAGIALVLAAVGLYAVTAYAVSQRTREISVRVALGAQARHVWWMVTRRASAHVAFGLILGAIGAAGAGQVLQGLLERTRGNDAVTLVGVPVLLVVVAIVACIAPARRAMRVNLVVALRSE